MSDSDLPNPFSDEDNPVKELVSQVMGTHRSPSEAEKEKAEKEEVQKEPERKHPRYPSEDERVQRRVSLDLGVEIKDALYQVVEDVAGRQQLSAVSRALLEYALDAYDSGRIVIEPRVGKSGVYFVAIQSNDEQSA